MGHHGTSTGPSAGHPGDQIMGYFRDVLGTTVKHVFKNQLTNTLILLWHATQYFKVNGSSEKFRKLCNG